MERLGFILQMLWQFILSEFQSKIQTKMTLKRDYSYESCSCVVMPSAEGHKTETVGSVA